jgi:hypothetical protein
MGTGQGFSHILAIDIEEAFPFRYHQGHLNQSLSYQHFRHRHLPPITLAVIILIVIMVFFIGWPITITSVVIIIIIIIIIIITASIVIITKEYVVFHHLHPHNGLLHHPLHHLNVAIVIDKIIIIAVATVSFAFPTVKFIATIEVISVSQPYQCLTLHRLHRHLGTTELVIFYCFASH